MHFLLSKIVMKNFAFLLNSAYCNTVIRDTSVNKSRSSSRNKVRLRGILPKIFLYKCWGKTVKIVNTLKCFCQTPTLIFTVLRSISFWGKTECPSTYLLHFGARQVNILIAKVNNRNMREQLMKMRIGSEVVKMACNQSNICIADLWWCFCPLKYKFSH